MQASDALILSIDQGTTSTRAIVFDAKGTAVTTAQQEFPQYFPQSGWVEHDAEEIWATSLTVCRNAVAALGGAQDRLAAIGITNQRETVVLWHRRTGKPIHRAIVWQDRRTADQCQRLRAAGHEARVSEKTGLLLYPYFSASKIAWILDHVDGARDAAERGELAFGTTDSFLLWRLTNGMVHATDATNASRTALFNIHSLQWDDELLDLFQIPRTLLPVVKDSADDYGQCDAGLIGVALPIAGVAGDQQAAAIGQACFSPGMIKSTYGTGCFVLLNTGGTAVSSTNRLLTTIASRIGGRTQYALEGSIFTAGAAVQWLRDGLGIIDSASQTEALASSVDDNQGVYLVPAFTGLGAPHWDPEARAAIFGLTRDTGRAQLVRAALESVCYQTADLLNAMATDSGRTLQTLRVDGGMAANNWLMQFLADVVNLRVERPRSTETTALGAAYLAGLQTGVFDSLDAIESQWQRRALFEPKIESATREDLLTGWRNALSKTLSA